MTIKRIHTPEGVFHHTINGKTLYSHVVISDRPKFVFISGQLSKDEKGNIVGPGDMKAQIRQVGENLKKALAAAGATLDDLVRTNTYVTDMEEFLANIDARHDYLGVTLPTSTTVEIKRLSHPDLVVEIDAIAMLP